MDLFLDIAFALAAALVVTAFLFLSNEALIRKDTHS